MVLDPLRSKMSLDLEEVFVERTKIAALYADAEQRRYGGYCCRLGSIGEDMKNFGFVTLNDEVASKIYRLL